MPEITLPRLGQILVETCGNEGRHRFLSEDEKATLNFLREAISFVPSALQDGADMRNTSFLFAQPGREFAIISGNGDWEFVFSQEANGEICGHCVRMPRLHYIWDRFKKSIYTVGRIFLPIAGPTFLALLP